MVRAALLLPLSVLTLAACGDKEGDPQAKPTEPTGDEVEDTVDDDDAYETGGFDFALRPVRVSPWTLDQATGGPVTVLLAGSATDDAGAEVALADAVAGSTFVVTLPDGEAVEATAEVVDAETVALTLELPAGMAPEGARAALEIGTEEAWITEAAVGLYGDATERMVAIAGDPTAALEVSDLTVCGVEADDADADGVYELLIAGIDGDGRPVLRGCAGFVGDDGDWTCEDSLQDELELEGDEGLLCGSTDHFKVDGGGSGFTATFATTAGRLWAVSNPTWTGGAWTGSGTVVPQTALGRFGVVIGLNTSKEEAAVPLDALLLVRGDDSGRWGGVYQEGREPWSWSSIGPVTPKNVGNQEAWAGLFTDHDLTGLTASADPSADWAWSLDASGGGAGEPMVLTVAQWSSGAGAFANVRQVAIDAPEFTVEAAAAAGQDLDADGVPELVVEAWGDGQHALWLVPAATDKAATAPVTRLLSNIGSAGGVGVPTRTDGGGTARNGGSTITIQGGDFIMADHTILTMVDSSITIHRVAEGWSAAEALDPERASVSGLPTGALAGIVVGAAAPPSEPGSHGVCLHGRCFALPGYSGTTSLQQGGGGLESDEMSTIAAENPIFVSQDGAQTNVLAGRAAGASGTPLLRTARTRIDRVPDGDAAGGFVLTADGEAVADSSARGRVAVALDSARDPVVFDFEVEEKLASAGSLEDETTSVTVHAVIHIQYADAAGHVVLPPDTTTGGSTVPRLLDHTVQDDGGLMLGWRDGAGQAWVGVLDVAAAVATADGEAPFLSGPVAVGGPIEDPEGALPFDFDTPGMAGARQAPRATDTPFLSMEDLEERFSDWDQPMAAPFSSAAGAHGPALVVVGDDAGQPALVALPAVDDLADLAPVTVVSGVPADEVPVPRMSATVVADAPQVVVCTRGTGEVGLALLDGAGLAAWTDGLVTLDDGHGDRVSAGDLNGDGLSDVVFGSGVEAVVVLSDGEGGALDGGVEARAMTNFAVLLGGADAGRECWDDDDKAYTVPVGAQVLVGESRSRSE